MRYMGGKIRQSKVLAKVAKQRFKGGPYVELFCGALGAAEKVVPALAEVGCTDFQLSDANGYLMSMWQAILNGWEPPDSVSQETYDHYKQFKHKPHNYSMAHDPMIGYCGFAMSFGGKWFGGLARNSAKDANAHPKQDVQKKATLRKAAIIDKYGCKLGCRDYVQFGNPAANGLVYLDPPYAGSKNFGGFDSAAFWAWAGVLSTYADVMVTEFEAPNGWEVAHSWGDTVVRHKNGVEDNKNTKNERIFVTKLEI